MFWRGFCGVFDVLCEVCARFWARKSDVLVRFWRGFGEALVRFCCVSNITRIPPAMLHCTLGVIGMLC